MVIIPKNASEKSSLKKTEGDIPVITIESNSATWKSISGDAKALKIEPRYKVESFFAVAQMAKAGMGHGLVPMGVARALAYKNSDLVRFKGQLKRPIQFVARKTTFEEKPIGKFLKELRRRYLAEKL